MAPTTDERFTRIYETHYPAVLAYCVRRVDRSDAEDVANEVFVVLWRNLDMFDDTFYDAGLSPGCTASPMARSATAGRAPDDGSSL